MGSIQTTTSLTTSGAMLLKTSVVSVLLIGLFLPNCFCLPAPEEHEGEGMRMKRSRYSEPYKPTAAEIKPYYKFDSFDVSLESSDDTDTNTKSVTDIVDLREAEEPSDTIEDNLIETEIVSTSDTEEVDVLKHL